MRIRFHFDPLHLGFAASPPANYVPQNVTPVFSLERWKAPVIALETAAEKSGVRLGSPSV